jgi:hypothetical protein
MKTTKQIADIIYSKKIENYIDFPITNLAVQLNRKCEIFNEVNTCFIRCKHLKQKIRLMSILEENKFNINNEYMPFSPVIAVVLD